MGERSSLEALDVPWARSAPARAVRGSAATCRFFSTEPMARDGRGLDSSTTAHLERAMRDDWCLVMFAEPKRELVGTTVP